MTKISVIIPTYNREKLIGETIQSVLNQSFKDFEIIIIDDGSSDNTKQVVESFSNEKISYIHQKNAGASISRNTGFSYAKGEYITFLDSDDLMLPHNLESLSTYLDQHPEVDIAYGWHYWIDNNKNPIPPFKNSQTSYSFDKDDSPWPEQDIQPDGRNIHGNLFLDLLTEEVLLLGCTLIRRKCIEKIQGFNPDTVYSEHWEFYLNLAKENFNFACIERPVLLIRLHSSNRGRDTDGMLSNTLSILKGFMDSQAEKIPSRKKNEAFFNAYFEAAEEYFLTKKIQKGVFCMQKSYELDMDFISKNKLRKISNAIADFCHTQGLTKTISTAEEIFHNIGYEKQSGLLKKMTYAEMYAGLSFRYKSRDKNLARKYGVQALSLDPDKLKNKGLLKNIFFTLIPTPIEKVIHNIKYPLDPSFIKKASLKTCVFISPHFDDAVLSCGGLLTKLAQAHAKILLITIFSKEPDQNIQLSEFAKDLYDSWGGEPFPYKTRKAEERKVNLFLNSEYRWLDFYDAIYRFPDLRKGNDVILTAGVSDDGELYSGILKKLTSLYNEFPEALFFAPLSLGNHLDHRIIQSVTEKLRKTYPGINLFYYEDFPYAAQENVKDFLVRYRSKIHSLNIDISKELKAKQALINLYQSQIEMLFNDSTEVLNEVMDYGNQVGLIGSPQERYWFFKKDVF